MKEFRTPEEIDADRHVFDLVMMDQHWRGQNQDSDSFPLEANGPALWAIRNYYLGKKHPTKYPEHAQNLKQYKQEMSKEAPHLSNYIDPQ